MEAKELRIGNFVYDEDKTIQPIISICGINPITHKFDEKLIIHNNNGLLSNIDTIHPIPLTEEWLIKFGFVRDNICVMSDIAASWHEERSKGSSMDKCYTLNKYSIIPRLGMTLMVGHINNSLKMDTTRVGRDNKYVHQLQNLYFALTGEELTCS